jgi:hypothetical protein
MAEGVLEDWAFDRVSVGAVEPLEPMSYRRIAGDATTRLRFSPVSPLGRRVDRS